MIENRPREAAFIYLELAEQGLAVAQLNAAILFDKYNIIGDSKRLLIGLLQKNESTEFNINKHMAFKFYRLAMHQRETEDEASLKLGDFYYNGVACL